MARPANARQILKSEVDRMHDIGRTWVSMSDNHIDDLVTDWFDGSWYATWMTAGDYDYVRRQIKGNLKPKKVKK